MNQIRLLLGLIRPFLLLLASLTYFLGLGVANYLGEIIDTVAAVQGIFWVLLFQVSSSLLIEYFRPNNEPIIEGQNSSEKIRFKQFLLQAALGCLAGVAALTVLMFHAGLLRNETLVFLLAFVFLGLMLSLPPIRLANRGYGELAEAVLLSFLTPVIAFSLQADGVNRVVAMVTFPLAILAILYMLVHNFPQYSQDLKYGRQSLLTRLTWQRAVRLHHVLLLAAYLLFALGPTFGLPWQVVWPAFLGAPLAFLQILMLENISRGGRPIWKLLTTNSAALFGLTTYFLALTFWLR